MLLHASFHSSLFRVSPEIPNQVVTQGGCQPGWYTQGRDWHGLRPSKGLSTGALRRERRKNARHCAAGIRARRMPFAMRHAL
jgi:hypothetical protein